MPNPEDHTGGESDAIIYRRMFVDVWRELHRLRADHEALMQVILETFPRSRALEILNAYDHRRAQLWQAALLKLEENLPNLAAELDKHRPLIEPNETAGSP